MSLKKGAAVPKQMEFKVQKTKPNILDKSSMKKGSPKESTPSPPGSPLPVSSAVSNAMNAKIEELVTELQKMKNIIVKHEVRIRDLERKLDSKLDNVNTEANNNGETLLPDEV